jgi:glyoxylase-like metal-dependent hydrolase (beta-lactamase superfamily II)
MMSGAALRRNGGMMLTQPLGEFRIDRVLESEGTFAPAKVLMPQFNPVMLAQAEADAWLRPQFLTADDALVMGFQSFVIRTGRLTILIDGCVGNDKERPQRETWHRRRSSAYLDQLTALGLSPDDIDVVMCTHLHADHVGWNTVLKDGRWVPTFPRARYLFSRTEYEFWEAAHRAALAAGGPPTNHGSFADSVLPVVEAGRAELVGDGHEVCAGVRIDAAPGHTPGNSVIAVQSGGQRALLTGDVIHTPVQIAVVVSFLRGRSAVGRLPRAPPQPYLRQRHAALCCALPVANGGLGGERRGRSHAVSLRRLLTRRPGRPRAGLCPLRRCGARGGI